TDRAAQLAAKLLPARVVGVDPRLRAREPVLGQAELVGLAGKRRILAAQMVDVAPLLSEHGNTARQQALPLVDRRDFRADALQAHLRLAKRGLQRPGNRAANNHAGLHGLTGRHFVSPSAAASGALPATRPSRACVARPS